MNSLLSIQMIIMKLVALILTLIFSAFFQVLNAQVPAFLRDSIDSYIERGMKQWQIPGLSIAIVKDGKVIHSKGYGVRELGKPDRVDENTLFIIASNSKLYRGVLEHIIWQSDNCEKG